MVPEESLKPIIEQIARESVLHQARYNRNADLCNVLVYEKEESSLYTNTTESKEDGNWKENIHVKLEHQSRHQDNDEVIPPNEIIVFIDERK